MCWTVRAINHWMKYCWSFALDCLRVVWEECGRQSSGRRAAEQHFARGDVRKQVDAPVAGSSWYLYALLKSCWAAIMSHYCSNTNSWDRNPVAERGGAFASSADWWADATFWEKRVFAPLALGRTVICGRVACANCARKMNECICISGDALTTPPSFGRKLFGNTFALFSTLSSILRWKFSVDN
jgi:hypothetical protein